MNYPIIVIALAGILGLLILHSWERTVERNDKTFTLEAYGVSCIVGIVFGLAFVIPLTKVVTETHYLIDPQGLVISSSPNGHFVWRWDPILDGKTTKRSYARVPHIAMIQVSPITENPKVRNLNFRVSVWGKGNTRRAEQYYSAFPDGNSTVGDSLSSQLYQIADVHGRELGEFFDPITQQQEFKILMGEFLEPWLSDRGLVFRNAGFSL